MTVQEAVTIFGTKKAIAEVLGIHPQAVYQWGVDIPPLRTYQLKEILKQKAS